MKNKYENLTLRGVLRTFLNDWRKVFSDEKIENLLAIEVWQYEENNRWIMDFVFEMPEDTNKDPIVEVGEFEDLSIEELTSLKHTGVNQERGTFSIMLEMTEEGNIIRTNSLKIGINEVDLENDLLHACIISVASLQRLSDFASIEICNINNCPILVME